MTILHFITGGQRSGKSSYAQNLLQQQCERPLYLATSDEHESEFCQRVARHKLDRGDQWRCFEEPLNPQLIPLKNEFVLLDCITLWLSNMFTEFNFDTDRCLEAFKQRCELLLSQPKYLVIVSNEIGMGVHASSKVGRRFVDLQGWANQWLANKADKVTFMVSGQALQIKDK